MVMDCDACNSYQNAQAKETLKPTKTPKLPWNELASDVFNFEGPNYLLTVDYFSKYIEVDHLPDLSSASTIQILKTQFCRHGIPEILRTDNATNYTSKENDNFYADYGIKLITSSPGFAQSNGEAERAIQTVKRMWKKCIDKQLALLNYRASPLESCGMSPAELLQSRKLRTKVPIRKELLKPQAYNTEQIHKKLELSKFTQAENYNRKCSNDKEVLWPGDPVRVAPFPGRKEWTPGVIVEHHKSPRSYIVKCGNGKKYRRNRKFLRLSTHEGNNQSVLNRDCQNVPCDIKSSVLVKEDSKQTVLAPDIPMDKQQPPQPEGCPCSSVQSPVRQHDISPTAGGNVSEELKTSRCGRVIKPPRRLDL
jgi:transposase InsO family protein